jgi:heme exporter protein C
MAHQAPSTSKGFELARWAWFLLTAAVLLNGYRVAMYVVPVDAEQGELSRILYYHVPSWAGMGVFFLLNLLASVAFLALRERSPQRALAADALALASAELGCVYCTIGLVTGSLWGRAAWGIWWTWDPRLTSTLILWLIYLAYLMLRRFAEGGAVRTLSAIMAIFGFLDVPLVYMSTRWWRTQHPAPVFGGGPNSGLDPSMMPALWWNLAGWLMWGVWVASLRYGSVREEQRRRDEAAQSALDGADSYPLGAHAEAAH